MGPRRAGAPARIHDEGRAHRPLPAATAALEPRALRDHGRGAGPALRAGPHAIAAGRAAVASRVPVPGHRHGLWRVVGVLARVDGGLPGRLHGPAARYTPGP